MLDARYAARRLRTRPVYAALAVLTLALGVGGMASISGIVRTLLVAPLPYPHDDQLVQFWRPGDWRAREVSVLRDHWDGFSAVAAYRNSDATLERPGAPSRLVPGIASSAELFQVLGVSPLLGRGFARGEDLPGAAPVAVLELLAVARPRRRPAHRRFDARARRNAAHRRRRDAAVVLVPGSDRRRVDHRHDQRHGRRRLLYDGGPSRAGQTRRQHAARDRQRDADARLAFHVRASSGTSRRTRSSRPLREPMVQEMRPALFATLAGMAAILLIACANVAALVLGQIESRAGELAVRTALGADRSRLATQIVIEVVVLGLAAGVVGAAIAIAGFGVLRGYAAARRVARTRHHRLDAARRVDRRRDALVARDLAVPRARAVATRPARHARRRSHERILEAPRRTARRDDRGRSRGRRAARVHRGPDRAQRQSPLQRSPRHRRARRRRARRRHADWHDDATRVTRC